MAIRSRIGGSEFKITRVDKDKGECDAMRLTDGKQFRNCPILNFRADSEAEFRRIFA